MGAIVPILIFVAAFLLYALTAARGTLFGDPSEYQFIPAIGGIAHPPGYAFYTLLAKVWQVLVPFGTIAFRTNLLAGAVGAWVVTAIYLIVLELAAKLPQLGDGAPRLAMVAAVFGAFGLAVAPDFWQHAIHANSHIVSAAMGATHLLLLVRWRSTGRDGYLAGFAFTVALAAVHHPVTLVGAPAYALFILLVEPRILKRWRLLLVMVGCGLLGLAPLLYYPLRSPSAPFGPTDMRTWEGFLGHATAQGLRVNLFHFGPVDQPHRALVFLSLLGVQFTLPVILLMAVGTGSLVRRAPRLTVLLGAFVASHLLFTLNTVQDVMAYLLLPFAALAALAGVGAMALGLWLVRLMGGMMAARTGASWAEARELPRARERVWEQRAPRAAVAVLTLLLLIWPLVQMGVSLGRGISLRDFTSAEEFVAAISERFGGQGERAVLLSDWEHLTPLWVHAFTQDRALAEEDLKLVYVSTRTPWVESVWAHIDEGPIYLPDYRPAVRNEGFRLVPEGAFYRVVAPPVTWAVPDHVLHIWAGERVHILGYDLPQTSARAGEHLELVLYQTAPELMVDIWMPYAQLGPVEARWTTDSRLLTPDWLPGEIVVERYEIPIPFDLAPGDHALRLGYANLTGGAPALELSTGAMPASTLVELATVTVLPAEHPPASKELDKALANLDNTIALNGARALRGLQVRKAFWQEPLEAEAGKPLHLLLTWRALSSPRESYTVFIHLLDGAGQYVAGHDYTPLGGAAPTYLWFPKWLPGQTYLDPYRFVVPADLPPGDYVLEVGMYAMTSLRRLPVVDSVGNLVGDRVILGPVRVGAAR
jgi:hypothetical protein